MTSANPGAKPAGVPAEEEALRADLYALLAALLSAPPDQPALDRLAALSGDGSELGQGIAALAGRAGAATAAAVKREHDALFIGLGRGELLPYASYYLTGHLQDRPLAALRRRMAALGVERAPGVREPEDHIATLCEIMAGLIRGAFGAPAPLAEQSAFFDAHLAPWAGCFFRDLEAAEAAVFYGPVGRIGRVLVEVEAEAFRMEA